MKASVVAGMCLIGAVVVSIAYLGLFMALRPVISGWRLAIFEFLFPIPIGRCGADVVWSILHDR